MTYKAKRTYGAEIAIHALDERPTYWGAHVTVHELEPDPDHGCGWVSHGNKSVDAVQFQIHTTDYIWKDEDRATLGLNSHGDWIIDCQWTHEMQASEAIHAGKLALLLDKRMVAFSDKWGYPATPQDVLKRAVQAIHPVGVRLGSDYQGKSGVDASKQWQDVRKSKDSYLDYLVRREWRHFSEILTKKRPDLFRSGTEVAT